MNLKTIIEAILVRIGPVVPDRIYLSIRYRLSEGYWMDFKNPKTLNEKLQWLKIHNRKPEYTDWVDKFAVKSYISGMIGEQYVIPTIGVWDSPDDIDFSKLPDRFVLKPTHNSSTGRCICQDKSKLDIPAVKRMLRQALKENYFYEWREWPYKDIKPRIIAEEYIENPDGTPIVDYKFYCYGGEPRYFMYSVGEADHTVRNCKFDMDGNNIDHLFKKERALSDDEIKLPENLDEMIRIVKILCKDQPHLRVDLYNVGGRILFGELTFYSGAGFIHIESKEFSQKMADHIDLSRIKS